MQASENAEREALEKTAIESIETLAFTEVVAGPPPAGFPAGAECLTAFIPIDGSGQMGIWMEKGFLGELAGTLFSLAPAELEEETLQDALKEFLNIVAGRYMSEDARSERVLTLGLPMEVPEGLPWAEFPVTCFLRAEPRGYFSLGLKP